MGPAATATAEQWQPPLRVARAGREHPQRSRRDGESPRERGLRPEDTGCKEPRGDLCLEIPAPGTYKQEDREFKTLLDYISPDYVRTCLRTDRRREEKLQAYAVAREFQSRASV